MRSPAAASIADAAALADEGTEPSSDHAASADFRRHLARVLTLRALDEASASAVGADVSRGRVGGRMPGPPTAISQLAQRVGGLGHRNLLEHGAEHVVRR